MSSQVEERLEALTAGRGERMRAGGHPWGALAAPRHLPGAQPLTWVHLTVSQLDLPLGLDHVEGQRQHRGHLWG